MDESKTIIVEKLLYDMNISDVKNNICKIEDQEILYVYAYNYNWDNGFDIPQLILEKENCNLSIALLLFYRADGLRYLIDKSESTNLSHWSSFVKKTYDSILSGRYQVGEIEFKVPLSKVQLFKLKKQITEQEIVFITNIEGESLDIVI